MRTCLLSLSLLLAGPAWAASIEPTSVATIPASSVVVLDNGAGLGADVRLYTNDLQYYACTLSGAGALTCTQTARSVLFAAGGTDFALTSGFSGRSNAVLTDACQGRILKVTHAGPATATASVVVDEFVGGNGGTVLLERPVAATVAGDQLFFSAGSLPDGVAATAECNAPDTLAPPHGGLIQVDDPFLSVVDPLRGELDQTVLVPASGDALAFSPEASRGVAFYSSPSSVNAEVWAVTGWTASDAGLENIAHLRRFETRATGGAATQLGGETRLSMSLLTGSAAVPSGVGEPRFLAPLQLAGEDPWVVVGTPNALLVFELSGRYLGPLWLATDRGGELDAAAELVSLSYDIAGGGVVGLFSDRSQEPDDDGDAGRILGYWTPDDVFDQLGRTIVVDPSSDHGHLCVKTQDGGTAQTCGTVQGGVSTAWDGEAVLVLDGTYEEQLHIYGRSVSLIANNSGRAVLAAPEGAGSVVFVESVDDIASALEGFVITGGIGVELDLFDDGVFSYGGGVLAFDSRLDLAETLLVRNKADRGAAIAAFGRVTELGLAQVGVVDNQSTDGGAIAITGTEPSPAVIAVFNSTLAGNCVDGDGPGLASFGFVDILVTESIFAFNGDSDVPGREGGSVPPSIEDTDLYFDPPLGEDELAGYGAGNLSVDPGFANLSDRTLVLRADTPALLDDGGPMGLYGDGVGALPFDLSSVADPLCFELGDDDDSAGDDDDAVDDDDAADDDDDDDSASPPVPPTLPSGLRCDGCEGSLAGSGGSSLALLMTLAALRRRRGGSPLPSADACSR